jgi:signal transduction histidine kinase
MSIKATIYVIDDDPAMIRLLRVVAQSLELQTQACETAEDLWRAPLPGGPKCLVLDVDSLDLGLPELQSQLAARRLNLPLIVMTSLRETELPADVAGNVALLRKPFRLQELCDALHVALRRSEDQAGAECRASETVLVADDSPSMAQFLTAYLDARGYRVLRAGNGAEALAVAAGERPDAILLDVMMPDMDGLTVCRRLRENPQLHAIPVILVTSRSDEDDVVRGLDAGADDYVLKPVNLRVLGARLRSALRAKKNQDTIARMNRELQAELARRKRMEMELLQAHKLEAIGRLAAGLAHEINTPAQYVGDNLRFVEDAFQSLDRLLATAHAALSQAADDSDQLIQDVDIAYLRQEVPEALRQSLAGINQIASIVRAMKEFSHPGSEQKQLVDLRRAIENTLTVTCNHWKQVADAVTEFDPSLPQVPCIAVSLNQVLLNLLVNAAEAIAERVGDGSRGKGTITVRTRRDGNWAVIEVADTGTGIPEEIRSKVFEPFFTTKDVGKGTGQGLALVHAAVVDKHGGLISFKTEVGAGTTFTIRLPLNASTTEAPAPAEPVAAVR